MTPEEIDAVATRLAEFLRQEQPVRFMTAAELAVHLKLGRQWVYDNADRLGATRVGNGKRAALRFDVLKAERAFARLSVPASPPRERRRGRRRKAPGLLPIGTGAPGART